MKTISFFVLFSSLIASLAFADADKKVNSEFCSAENIFKRLNTFKLYESGVDEVNDDTARHMAQVLLRICEFKANEEDLFDLIKDYSHLKTNEEKLALLYKKNGDLKKYGMIKNISELLSLESGESLCDAKDIVSTFVSVEVDGYEPGSENVSLKNNGLVSDYLNLCSSLNVTREQLDSILSTFNKREVFVPIFEDVKKEFIREVTTYLKNFSNANRKK